MLTHTERAVPRYQATHFPGMGTTLDAVTEDGKCHTIAGIGTCRDWTINDCRNYARSNGFTVETQRHVDGLLVVDWTEPVPNVVDDQGRSVPYTCITDERSGRWVLHGF